MDLRVVYALTLVLFLCGCSFEKSESREGKIYTRDIVGVQIPEEEIEGGIESSSENIQGITSDITKTISEGIPNPFQKSEPTNEEILEELGCEELEYFSTEHDICWTEYVRRTGDTTECERIRSLAIKSSIC